MSERGLNDLGSLQDNLPSVSDGGANNHSTPSQANALDFSVEFVGNISNSSILVETSVLGSTVSTNQEETVAESPRVTFAHSAESVNEIMISPKVEPPAVATDVNLNLVPVPPLEVNPVQESPSIDANLMSNKMDGSKVFKKEASRYINPISGFETPQKKSADTDKATTSQQQLDLNYMTMTPITANDVIRIEFIITDEITVNQLSAQACRDGFIHPPQGVRTPENMKSYLNSVTDGIKAILLKIGFHVRISYKGLSILETSESALRNLFPVGDLTVALTQYLRDPNATLLNINVAVLPNSVDCSRAIQWINFVFTHQALLAFPLPQFPIETGSGMTPLLITKSTRLY